MVIVAEAYEERLSGMSEQLDKQSKVIVALSDVLLSLGFDMVDIVDLTESQTSAPPVVSRRRFRTMMLMSWAMPSWELAESAHWFVRLFAW